jgi:hypothetical protein
MPRHCLEYFRNPGEPGQVPLEILHFWDQSDILLEKRLNPDASG